MPRITGLAIGDNRIKLEDADSLNQKIDKKQNTLIEGLGIGIQNDTIQTYAVLSTSVNGNDIPIYDNSLELELTKETVGLDKVDNNSDKEKPISDAAQVELNKKANQSDIGDLTTLTTTSKDSLVNAINELEAKQVPVATDTVKGIISVPLGSDILNTDGSLTIKDTIARQTEIERLDNENTALTEKIDKEIQDRQAADDLKADKTAVEALLKVYNYEAGLSLKIGYLINLGNKLYIAKEEFVTTDWNTDEPRLEPANTDTISCVTYEAGLKISKGQLVIYNNNIWICTADVETTTDWATDSTSMVDSNITIDLSIIIPRMN